MAKQPSILIVVIDSLRADHVSSYGYARETTPNIDRLAEEGCLFETAITAAPFSPASYASMFSNLYPHEHGVNGDSVRVWPDHFERLAEKMQRRGYATFGLSSNGFVGQATNSTQGFDTFIETYRRGWAARKYSGLVRRVRTVAGDRTADLMEPHHVKWPEMRRSHQAMQHVRRFIDETDGPFFAFAILMDPHAPYDTKRLQYCGHSPAVRRFFRNINDGKMYAKLMARRAGLTEDDLRIAIDLYDAEINHADRCVGELIESLRRTGRLDDTVVVVAADHGEAFGEHGVWGHGFCLNDCLTRVPLIVRCPQYWPAGRRSTALVQLHDVHVLCESVSDHRMPDAARHPFCLTRAASPDWAGRSIVFSEFPVQTGTLRTFKQLNPTFEEKAWGCDLWAVRTHEWRYIEYSDGGVELYDLASDPGETRSVLDQHRDIAADLKNCLREHRSGQRGARESRREPEEEAIDDVVLERLRDLGYIE